MEDGQQNVRVRLLEGESENPVFCSALGQCVVHLDRALPKGTPIRVCCSYDSNGTISVSAQVPATKASATVELRREGFAEMEPLSVWRKRLSTADSPLEREPGLQLAPPSAEFGPDSDINELLARLDQLYAHAGQQVIESAVPPSAVQLQRLAKQTQLETAALKHLIELLNKRQERQKLPYERMELQSHIARVRMAWSQANKLHVHSFVGLGRVYLHEQKDNGLDDGLVAEVAQLESWLAARAGS